MPAPVSIARDDAPASAGSLHVAIGWLTAAIEAEHPGFIKEQAAKAAKFYFEHPEYSQPGVVAVLQQWAAGR